MSRRVRVEIYAPAHFRATWDKFKEILERDGTTPSAELRTWIEGYVARKDPGNPQRPITAYVKDHEDEVAMKRTEKIKRYLDRSILFGGEIRFRRIVDDMKADGVPPHRREPMAKAMATDLEKLGVTIVY